MEPLRDNLSRIKSQLGQVRKPEKFCGFPRNPRGNCWQYPRIMDKYWHMITGSEQKALDYIIRHTWGYGKYADSPDCISYSQFLNGMKKRDGSVIDYGCGIKSSATLRRALKGLMKKGFVTIARNPKLNTSEFRLVIE